MSFDATSSYPSAMWDEKSVYPDKKTGYPCRTDLKDQLIKKFETQIFVKVVPS